MRRVLSLTIGCAGLLAAGLAWQQHAQAQAEHRVVRIAEIEVDPQQLALYDAALREVIKTAVRSEPGVLALYAVSVKDHPEQIRVFEVYKNQKAYQLHLQTAHFRKYKAATQGMVRSLKLTDMDPILLARKR